MKETIKKTIKKIKEGEYDDLKVVLCDFFDLGNRPECIGCSKSATQLEDCRSYYLERIFSAPLEVWDESFDVKTLKERQRVAIETLDKIGVNCDTCYMYDKCPMYKKGYVCAIKWDDNRPETPVDFLDFLINAQYERVNRAITIERMDGGVPDANLSNEMDRLKELVDTKVDIGKEKLNISIEATGASTTGGILSKIFGNNEKQLDHKTIEIPEKPQSMNDIQDVTEVIEIVESEKEPIKIKAPKRNFKNGQR